ncbi:MAG TPA: hypothetical protein VJV78_02775 [Polyangiales bacterium]|nr:hypothetical protein [Polyangiales bacterium]
MNVRARSGIAIALLAAACATPGSGAGLLRFSAPQGAVLNEFYREGPVAAHVVLTPGHAPRIVVAFPAGNSGAALFCAARSELSWQPQVALRAAEGNGTFHGVTAELTAHGGPLEIRQAVVGSIRSIRGFQDNGTLPAELSTRPFTSDRTLVWRRQRLDGAAGYYLALEVLRGTLVRTDDGFSLVAADDGELRLRLTALTADAPLTPIDSAQLFTPQAAADERLRETFSFLAYRQKLLAGSWRFDTYFGRDTLMSLLLLGAALTPAVIEAGLGAVLERLNAAGEVAHEEEIGEFAVLSRRRAGLPLSAAPLLDYKMVDDDFMLAPVAADYLLSTSAARAREFLARKSASGSTYGELLVRNLRFVAQSAAPFAREPHWTRLISLKPGQDAGNWRDSQQGLGGGRYPFDVNGVFVPAALDAISRLHASHRLDEYANAPIRADLASAANLAAVWWSKAPALFEVSIAETARSALAGYAKSIGVGLPPPNDAVVPLRFHAVALAEGGAPVPIANSDEAFTLLLSNPRPSEVARIAGLLTTRFPVGLMTDVGPVVANPAYAPAELSQRFDHNHYHGTVIWSWQQAVVAAGLERQLQRTDLTEAMRAELLRARVRIRAAIAATQDLRGTELWSWTYEGQHFHAAPFGARAQHETESNAAQLWSTVYLAQPRE